MADNSKYKQVYISRPKASGLLSECMEYHDGMTEGGLVEMLLVREQARIVLIRDRCTCKTEDKRIGDHHDEACDNCLPF